MAIVKGKAQVTTSVQGESEGSDVFIRALRDGSIVNSDWKAAAVIGGFGHMVNLGTFSTPVAGGGSASVIDLDRPRYQLAVPNGICIMPLRIGVHVQTGAPADGNEVEILIAVDQDASNSTGGTATAGTIYNMNTLSARASACTARHTFSATMATDPVLDLELARKVIEYDKAASGEVAVICDLVYEPDSPPILNGPCALYVYYGGDAAVAGGYADIQWLEFTEDKFSV